MVRDYLAKPKKLHSHVIVLKFFFFRDFSTVEEDLAALLGLECQSGVVVAVLDDSVLQ